MAPRPGGGSVFTITLPRIHATGVPAPARGHLG